MFQRYTAAFAIAGLLAAAGCGAGGGGVPTTTVNPGNPGVLGLQFAVGTVNLYGLTGVGLNVVSTLRQPDGSSIGVSTPTLDGPFVVTAPAVASFADATNNGFPDPYTTVFNDGPSAREHGRNTLFGTPQTVAPGTPACDGPGPFPLNKGFVQCPNGLSPNTSTFGQSGGVFAMGLLPANELAAPCSSTNTVYSDQPYPQPFFSGTEPTNYQYEFVPWGGPPAFDPFQTSMGMRSGLSPLQDDCFGDPVWLGVGEGITAFAGVKARAGSYTLKVAIATVGSGGVTTNVVSKTAHLDLSVKLPDVHAPVFTPDGNGGGSVTTSLPGRVTEAYVQIVDWGPNGGPNESGGVSTPSNCQGALGTSFAPVYYTIHVTGKAQATYKLPDTIGPNLNTKGGKSNLKPSPSICTAAQNTATAGSSAPGDDIVVQTIGFDYPVYQAALGITQQTIPQFPRITNGSGQADVTISQALEQNGGSVQQAPAIVRHRPHASFARRTLR